MVNKTYILIFVLVNLTVSFSQNELFNDYTIKEQNTFTQKYKVGANNVFHVISSFATSAEFVNIKNPATVNTVKQIAESNIFTTYVLIIF